jgi:hypothetical protein
MSAPKRISVWAACLQVGGYPKLLVNLARQHGVQVHVIGRARYVNCDDLGRLGEIVHDWLNRPRMSRLPKTRMEARLGGSTEDSLSEVIRENAEEP